MTRPASPATSNVTTVEIDEYCTSFQKKMGSFVQPRGDLTEEEAAKLGMKNEDDEVEKFVQVKLVTICCPSRV